MATYRATTGNDNWTVPEFGDPSGTLIDGLAGVDALYFDRLPRSRFIIKLDSASGNILVDSVSGASSTYHLKLKNVEYLVFSNGSDVLNLSTAFGDTTAPTVTQFSPLVSASNVPLASNITITFSETIVRGSGNIVLVDNTGKTVETFAAATSANLTLSNNQLVINPTNDLLLAQIYTVKIDPAAIKDAAGNAYAGTSSYSFSTPANHTPVAASAQFNVNENAVLTSQLPAATDPDPQTLSYALVQNPAHGALSLNNDGSFVYTPVQNYLGTDSFTYVVNDGIVNSTAAVTTLTVTEAINSIIGTNGADVLVGTAGKDGIQGGAGNDILTGSGGNDSLDGGDGIDVASYSGARSNYQLTLTGGTLQVNDLTGTDGTDTLVNIERLHFTDKSVAFDLSGAAGMAAKVIGAVLGPAGLADKGHIGQALNLLDHQVSYEQLLTAAINLVLGNNATSKQIVDMLYTDVIGSAPPPATEAFYTNLLDSGAYSIGKLAAMAADTGYNAAHINLVGLTQSGLEYLPVA